MVIEAARRLGWIVYHIPDSRLATAPGFPILVLLRQYEGPARLILAELKKQNGRVSPAQKVWLTLLAKCPGLEVYTPEAAMWRA